MICRRWNISRSKHARILLLGLGAIACAALLSRPTVAEPVAIVEDVSSADAGVELFDYLNEGHNIELGEDDQLVIGYLSSCRRETITGGSVTVGSERSEVVGGTVSRDLVQCDGGHLQLNDAQSEESGVLVLRKPPKSASGTLPEVALTIYGTMPIFRLAAPAEQLTVFRLDRSDPPVIVSASGIWVDLGDHELRRGGLYRAVAADRDIVFRVDRFARKGDQPLLSRLVPL